jgi:plasmid stabilization system protein ParE
MKVVFTDDALRDLDEILRYISMNYPGVYAPFETRLRTIVTRIGNWPEILHVHHSARSDEIER